jgi:hypothetical protein
VELFGFQQQLRGIFESLDDGTNRREQLRVMNDAVKEQVAQAELSVADSQSLALDQNQQVNDSVLLQCTAHTPNFKFMRPSTSIPSTV